MSSPARASKKAVNTSSPGKYSRSASKGCFIVSILIVIIVRLSPVIAQGIL